MEEIKVGEYIKTVAGYIGKIINFSDGMYTAQMKDATIDLYINDIVNHNEDIALLIGYGDYINGRKCIDIEPYMRSDGTPNINFVCLGGSVLKENIKTIVTKEQFNQMKYIVGDE